MPSNFEVPTSIKPFLSSDDIVFFSKLIGHQKRSSQAQQNAMSLLNLFEDENHAKHTYFDQKAKLNVSAMLEYELKVDASQPESRAQDEKVVQEEKLLNADD